MSPYKLSTLDSRDAHALTASDLDSLLGPSRRDGGRVQVLGHRGSVGPDAPENSAAAVTEALLRGADGAEVDVWLTADGTLVVAHELPTGDLDSFSTLTDVLVAAQAAEGFQLVVEAKPVADAAVASATAEALASVLGSAGSADVTISSFDAALLATIRAACADLPVRTALLGEASEPATAAVRRAHQDGHDEVHLPLAGVRQTPEVVELAHRLGLEVALWTVNRRADLQWVAELGVDAVITDDVLTAWSELDRAATSREPAAV